MPDPDDDLEQHPDGRFADQTRIGHNAFKFLLDFGQGGEFHTRIVTSPGNLQQFIETATRALREHRSRALNSRTATGRESRSAVLLENLGYLDQLLKRAFERAHKVFDREAEGESRPWELRGLVISREDAVRTLVRRPGDPHISAVREEDDAIGPFGRNPVWGEAGLRLGLTPFDQAVTLIALAPEIDLRYEKLYAYLNDDVTHRRPTVSLALDILSASAEEKMELRAQFGAGSPLVRAGLLTVTPDPNRTNSPWLDHTITLDALAVAFLLGDDSLDTRLTRFCEMVASGPRGRVARVDIEALGSLAVEARREGAPLAICLHGPGGSHQREAAEWIAFATGAPILIVNLAADSDQALEHAARHALLRDPILYLDAVDSVLNDPARLAAVEHILAEHPGITILNSTKPWPGRATDDTRAVLNVPFAPPDFAARRGSWHSHLRRSGLPDDQHLIDKLAGSFVLSYSEIGAAVAETAVRLRWLGAERPDEPLDHRQFRNETIAAARAQAGRELAALARKIEPVYRWSDIVLPAETETQLHEIAARVSLRHQVLEQWGFARKLANTSGVSALFTGPSGAGKSMAAEVIANELSVDLYKIDLSGVVSKYIGETEKNLERIFVAAERSNAILFFDEADALFGKRSEVHDAHDRYANIEVSYLLQRMEQYEGIAILATNLRANLDDAFVRRIAYAVRFALPAEAERFKIWERIWPSKDLLAPDVDLASIARAFKLSGGNIRNIALAASFFAAARSERVTQEDILRAVQREYEKVGKTTQISDLHAAVAA